MTSTLSLVDAVKIIMDKHPELELGKLYAKAVKANLSAKLLLENGDFDGASALAIKSSLLMYRAAYAVTEVTTFEDGREIAELLIGASDSTLSLVRVAGEQPKIESVALKDGTLAEVRSANGINGILCLTIDRKYFIRVKNEDGSSSDYRYRHSDLNIRIQDEDAFFYAVGDDDKWLDHSPATLGLCRK